MIEKPDREKMRESLRKKVLEVGFRAALTPEVTLQLLDQIDELEARLATEREAGYMEAVDILKADSANDHFMEYRTKKQFPTQWAWVEFLKLKWKEKQK